MKMATPSMPTADDEVAALLAQADALVDSRKEAPAGGQPEYVSHDTIDLEAEVRRTVLWFRPYMVAPREPPTFKSVEPEGALFRDQAVVWRSRTDDPAGPWLALALTPRYALPGSEIDAVGCWRHFWRKWRKELLFGEDWEINAGDHPVAQKWMALALQEVVHERGTICAFPAEADTAHVAEAKELAKSAGGMGYMNAWRRAKGEHQRPPIAPPSLQELHAKAMNAVQDAAALLDKARFAVDQRRADRALARRKRDAERLAHPIAARLHDNGWRPSLTLAALEQAVAQANLDVQAAKAIEKDASTVLMAQQELLDETATTWRKALAAAANDATKAK